MGVWANRTSFFPPPRASSFATGMLDRATLPSSTTISTSKVALSLGLIETGEGPARVTLLELCHRNGSLLPFQNVPAPVEARHLRVDLAHGVDGKADFPAHLPGEVNLELFLWRLDRERTVHEPFLESHLAVPKGEFCRVQADLADRAAPFRAGFPLCPRKGMSPGRVPGESCSGWV